MLSYLFRLINTRSTYGVLVISIALSVVNLVLIISTATLLSLIFGGDDNSTSKVYLLIQRYFAEDNIVQIIGTIYICSVIVYAILTVVFLKISYHQEYLISDKIYKNRLNLKMQPSPTTSYGEIIKNIVQEPSRVTHGYVFPLLNSFNKMLQVFVTVVFLVFQDWMLTLLSSGFVLLAYYWVRQITSKKMKELGEQCVVENKKRYELVANTMSSKKEILTYDLQTRYEQQFQLTSRRYVSALFLCDAVALVPRYALELLFVCGAGLFYFLQIGGDVILSADTAFIFMAAGLRLLPIVHAAYHSLTVMSFNLESLKVVLKELELDNGVTTTIEPEQLTSDAPLDVSHKVLLIKGANGIGKTTFLDYLAGILNFELKFSHHLNDIKKIDNVKPTYATQFPAIFPGTVLDNIVLDRTEFNRLDLERQCNLFDLSLDDDAQSLSGGRKQIVSIIRARFWSEGLILMDEPSSALDDKNKKTLISEISRDTNNKYVIVTHDAAFDKLNGTNIHLLRETDAKK